MVPLLNGDKCEQPDQGSRNRADTPVCPRKLQGPGPFSNRDLRRGIADDTKHAAAMGTGLGHIGEQCTNRPALQSVHLLPGCFEGRFYLSQGFRVGHDMHVTRSLGLFVWTCSTSNRWLRASVREPAALDVKIFRSGVVVTWTKRQLTRANFRRHGARA